MIHQTPDIVGEPVNGSPDEAQQLRSFTSWKLDIINCIAIDPRLTASDVRLAIILLRHLNSISGQCNPGDEVLAQQMKSDKKTVYNCRVRLRKTGWLTWKRTQKTNWYAFHDTHVNTMLDYLLSMQEANRERRELDIQTRNQLRIEKQDTGNRLPNQTRNVLLNRTRNVLLTNTLTEHLNRTPEDSIGIDRKDMNKGTYIPPSFDHLDRKEGSK